MHGHCAISTLGVLFSGFLGVGVVGSIVFEGNHLFALDLASTVVFNRPCCLSYVNLMCLDPTI